MGSVCPICNKKIANPLEHYRIFHDIEDTEQFVQVMVKIEKNNERKNRFAQYSDELKQKVQNKLITAEEYRKLVTEFWQST